MTHLCLKVFIGTSVDKDRLITIIENFRELGVTLSSHCLKEVWKAKVAMAVKYEDYTSAMDLLHESAAEVCTPRLQARWCLYSHRPCLR